MLKTMQTELFTQLKNEQKEEATVEYIELSIHCVLKMFLLNPLIKYWLFSAF